MCQNQPTKGDHARHTALLPALALVLVIIFVLILRAVLRAHAERLRPVAEEPRPPQIIAALQAAPRLEQRQAAKAYVGMKVRWHMIFEDVTSAGLTLTLMLQDPASLSPRMPFAWVVCDVRRGKYPQLNGMVQHTPLWVSGQIQSVRDEIIILKNPQLEFED